MRDARPAQTRARGKALSTLLGRLLGMRRRPGALLLVAIVAGAAVGVPMNALFFQDGHHPAPLFTGAQDKTATPLPPARPATARVDADAKPAKAETHKSDTDAVVKSATPKADLAKSLAPVEKKRDLIGQLLGGGAMPAEPAADKTVIYAQRALAKLGYAVQPDGVIGGATRQAIEKFERANGMPVKGDLSQKILRQLAARSGLPRP